MFAIAGLITLAGQIAILLPFVFARPELAVDAVQLKAAGERIRDGKPLYWRWAEYGPHVDAVDGPQRPLETTAYPPLVVPFFVATADLPFDAFARTWAVILLVGSWLYAAALARIAVGRLSLTGVLIAGLVLAITPGAGTNVKQGNIDPILWAAYGWALARPGAQGLGLAFAASVKVFFLWPLLLGVRDRRRWIDALFVFAGLALTAVLIMGPASFVQACIGWFREVPAYHGQGTFRPWNVSLSFAVLRILVLSGWTYVPGPLPTVLHGYLVVVGIAAPVAAAWLLRRRRREVRQSGILCAAVLFAPICWLSYLPLALPLGAMTIHTLLNRLNAHTVAGERRLEIQRAR